MFLKVLNWLNLLDSEKKFSITNAAIYALVIKMLVAPALDWQSVTVMLITFANYAHKRTITNSASAADTTAEMAEIKAQYEAAVVAQAKAITDIQSKVAGLAQLADLSKMLKR